MIGSGGGTAFKFVPAMMFTALAGRIPTHYRREAFPRVGAEVQVTRLQYNRIIFPVRKKDGITCSRFDSSLLV